VVRQAQDSQLMAQDEDLQVLAAWPRASASAWMERHSVRQLSFEGTRVSLREVSEGATLPRDG